MKRWFWPVLYFFCLLSLSSIPGKKLHVGWSFPNADKVVHVVLYSGEGFLVRRALASNPGTVAVVMALGLSDEFYQRWTPGRDCSFYDWLADTAGGVVGCLTYLAYAHIRRRPTSS